MFNFRLIPDLVLVPWQVTEDYVRSNGRQKRKKLIFKFGVLCLEVLCCILH